jgi:hypothetical protein
VKYFCYVVNTGEHPRLLHLVCSSFPQPHALLQPFIISSYHFAAQHVFVKMLLTNEHMYLSVDLAYFLFII